MVKNDIITATAYDINDQGDGIARPDEACGGDGRVVFCRGLLPNETATVQIIKLTSSYAVARLIELKEPHSPARRANVCKGFDNACGGCQFCHMDYASQLAMKRKRVVDCLVHIGRFDAELTENAVAECIADEHFTGRNKSSYPFTTVNGIVMCGFFARNSHRVVPLTEDIQCLTESPEVRAVRMAVCAVATHHNFSVYDEASNKGLLRHLVVRYSELTKRAMVIIVATQKSFPCEDDFARELIEACPFIDSIFVNLNAKPTNVIFGSLFRLVCGEPELINSIGDAVFRISPASFFQVNTCQAEKLYSTAYEYAALNDSTRILDLYCGTGTIGIYMLKRFESAHGSCAKLSLAGVESVADAVLDAKENARRNSLDNCVFIEADAAEGSSFLMERGFRPDIIILDPPRKGCDDDMLRIVLESDVRKIIYISCNPSTLARDLKVLSDGGYALERVQPLDMFPMSGHVETVVLMTKSED